MPHSPQPLRWEIDFYGGAALLVLGLHAVLYCIDPAVQVFLGDSASYLATGWIDYIPPDRSYCYGYGIALLTRWSGDLASLVAGQVGLHVVTTLLFLFIARAQLGASRRRALSLALLASALPAHVVWTRYVMTETASMAALAGFVACALCYVRGGRWPWLLPMHVLGLAAVALRLVMVPAVLGTAIALPIAVAIARRGPRPGWALARGAGHLAVSLACVALLHGAYRDDYAARLSRHERLETPLPSSYTFARGLSELCLVAPLVQASDFPAGVDGEAVLRGVQPALRDRRAREAHRWAPGGLCDRLKAAVGDTTDLAPRTDAVAAATARSALWRQPLAFAAFGLHTLADYWDARYMTWALHRDLMLDRPVDEGLRGEFSRRYGLHVPAGIRPATPLQRGYVATQWYLAVVAFAFVLVPPALWLQRRERWLPFAVVAALLTYFNLAAGVLALFVIPRYLLPASWLLWLLAAGFAPRRRRR